MKFRMWFGANENGTRQAVASHHSAYGYIVLGLLASCANQLAQCHHTKFRDF